MTKRDILSIALKIIGIIGFFRLMIYLPSTLFSLAAYDQFAAQKQTNLSQGAFFAAAIVYQVLLIIIALVFIMKSDQIARKMIPVDSQIPAYNTAGSGRAILTIASQVFGVYMLATGIPSFVQAIFRSQETTMYGDSLTRAMFRSQNVEAVATLVVGILLLLGAKYLADWIYKRETAPVTDEVNEQDERV